MNVVNTADRIPYRQQQALATRARVAASAQQLFMEQGYAATSIEAIAGAAGVAVSTVYAIFRNKRSILAAICEAWLEEAEIRPLLAGALHDPNLRSRMATAAHWTRQQWERGSEIVPLLNTAAQTDADVAAMLREWIDEKSSAMAVFVNSLEGSLRPGLDLAHARHLFDALTIPEIYHELVERAGWTPGAFEEWLAATLTDQLLGHGDE